MSVGGLPKHQQEIRRDKRLKRMAGEWPWEMRRRYFPGPAPLKKQSWPRERVLTEVWGIVNGHGL